jgi:hypothetical protein
MVGRLELGWRDVAAGGVETAGVPEVDPGRERAVGTKLHATNEEEALADVKGSASRPGARPQTWVPRIDPVGVAEAAGALAEPRSPVPGLARARSAGLDATIGTPLAVTTIYLLLPIGIAAAVTRRAQVAQRAVGRASGDRGWGEAKETDGTCPQAGHGRILNAAREAATRGPYAGRRDRAEPLARPTRP